jgi:hypothetical protein
MQTWVLVGAWTFAALLAVVLLGFAGYEIAWKARRLASDRGRLEDVLTELQDTAARLRMPGDRASADTPSDRRAG